MVPTVVFKKGVEVETENKFMKRLLKHGYAYNLEDTLMNTVKGIFGICIL
jgi:ATP-binding cassette subfamily B protein